MCTSDNLKHYKEDDNYLEKNIGKTRMFDEHINLKNYILESLRFTSPFSIIYISSFCELEQESP